MSILWHVDFTSFEKEDLLTHYHTMPHFATLKIYSCRKHCEKRRNCLLQAISPFLTLFSTLYGTYFPFEMHFKMSSAISFNLDQSKILSSGNGLINPLPYTADFKQTWERSFLKTLWEKEKMLVTSNFPFSNNVFYPSQKKFHFFSHIYFVVCKC